MNLKNYRNGLVAILLLHATGAAAITITVPKANEVLNSKLVNIEVDGRCQIGIPVRVNARDSSGLTTDTLWTPCQADSWFATPLKVSALKAGTTVITAYQTIGGKNYSTTVTVSRKASTSPTPTPVPTVTPAPTVAPTATPKPTVTPAPTVAPTATPIASSGIIFGVGGHDGRLNYPTSQSEAVFKMLSAKNLRTYRLDVDPRNFELLDLMSSLAKKYNIALRPMVYPISSDAAQLQDVAYQMAKRYANDIKIWEIGNEQDYDRAGAQGRINNMVAMYKGIKKASDELGAGLKTTINVMACNSDDTSSTGRCAGDKNGDMWFLDMAKASGFNFDYISFHYYVWVGDPGYWYNMFLGQMRNMAVKYKTKIFFNETNCGDIYRGNTDGGTVGDRGCGDAVKQLFDTLKSSYTDVVAEVNMYELFDETNIAGVEGHFGLMYNINSPKPTFNILVDAAK